MVPIHMMRSLVLVAALLLGVNAVPTAIDSENHVTYHGFARNRVEVFQGIRYGKDTSGPNRFKPPRPSVPKSGSTIKAQSPGHACPQPPANFVPLALSTFDNISEDCLNLDVTRPKGTESGDELPVMVFIHGGSFWFGGTEEITTLPDGLIQKSVHNGKPIMHVTINYRLGVFGFAKSDSLRAEKSENAGLRDQRLAIEWVRDNIHHFGGNPEQITIFGQSSGGLAIGMQTLAYGGEKPLPFQQGICESQALEPGITGNFTEVAMTDVINYIGCDGNNEYSDPISCLRKLDTMTLLNASAATYTADIAHNIGDIWLPTVDGDFLPAAPSQLVKEKRFGNVTTMIGWCDDDVTYFTPIDIATKQDTREFVHSYVPGLTKSSIDELLSLYPSSDFAPSPVSNLTSEFYRSARIFRDIIMTCMPIWYGQNLHDAGNDVYLYDFNQTVLDTPLNKLYSKGLGPVHTSEFAYIFNNISHYDFDDLPYHPTKSDFKLANRASSSWALFAASGHPSKDGSNTFQGWNEAFENGDTNVFVAGGAHEGLSPISGTGSSPALRAQHLKERCDFLNSNKIIKQLQF